MALVTQKLVKFLGFNTFIMETNKVGKKEYTVLRTTPTFVSKRLKIVLLIVSNSWRTTKIISVMKMKILSSSPTEIIIQSL